jgi:carboxypeptidase family protein
MKKRLESKLNMYDAVIAYCNNNAIVTATVAAFQTALTDFSAKVADIRDTVQMAEDVIIGVAMDKTQAQKDLAAQASTIAAAVFAFAASSNNNALKEKVNYTSSDFLRLKDGLLGPVCLNIHDAAQANLASLASYNITAAMLTAFSADISDYMDAVPSPRNAVTQRAANFQALEALFKEADSVLKTQMDKTALLFVSANPEFYTNYRNNRIILDAGSTPSQIKGKVLQAANSKPLEGASVQVVGEGVAGISNNAGIFTLKPLQPGTYSIKVSKQGFADETINNIVVKLGRSVTAIAEMNLPAAS